MNGKLIMVTFAVCLALLIFCSAILGLVLRMSRQLDALQLPTKIEASTITYVWADNNTKCLIELTDINADLEADKHYYITFPNPPSINKGGKP